MPGQGTLELTLLDVENQPAADPSTEIEVFAVSTGRVLSRTQGVVFPVDFRVTLPSFPLAQGLATRIVPQRYRALTSPIFTLTEGQVLRQSPRAFRLPPQWNARFTHWDDLPAMFDALRAVLTASLNVALLKTDQPLGNFAGGTFDDVDAMPVILAKTALLNLYAKMRKVPAPTGSAADWFEYVTNVLRMGQERFVAVVQPAMWQAVAAIHGSIAQYPQFIQAETSLHVQNVPEPYRSQIAEMISIKSKEAHGNLQLTMTKCQAVGATAYLLDADIDDDEDFFKHTRDLFVHLFTGGTHPFDVHEMLIDAYGALTLGYELV